MIVPWDPFDPNLGLLALPAAAAGAAGGLPTADANNAVKLQVGTGANQINLSAGAVTVGTNGDKAGYSLAQAFPANFANLAVGAAGTVTVGTNNDKSGYVISQAFPANFAALSVNASGAVTVGTNNDKSGYALIQGFPANFAGLAINAGGAVTVGTNSDKSGYSLAQAFPANFATLAVNAAGAVTVGTNGDKLGYSLSQAFPANFASLAVNAGGVVTASMTPAESFALTSGTAQNGTATTITLATAASSVDHAYEGSLVRITGGAGAGQRAAVITGYVGATRTATVDRPWLTTPDSTSAYAVLVGAETPLNANLQPTVAGVATPVTVGTNTDKSGYSLTQAFPANFANLAVNPAGAITVGTNNDKANYLVASSDLDGVVIEPGVNARQAVNAILAASVGVISGAPTNAIAIQGGNSATTRINAIVDANGNRTSVTLNLPS